jgi:hypothetical protein
MSAESTPWPPETNSALGGTGPEPPNLDLPSVSGLPDPSEKLREFVEAFGEQAHVPVSEVHGRELRAECVVEETEVHEIEVDDGGTETVEEVTDRHAVPLWRAVAEMLEWHAEYLESTLRLEYGIESDPSHRLLDVDLENSWMAEYQKAERARLKALERETCGYETCEECEERYCTEAGEHETEYVAGEFEEPAVVLTGRTSRGAGRPPVDHAREIAETWTGEVRRSLRYILEERLGLESHQWVRWTQGEPHPGVGPNCGYHHAHDVIIIDLAAVDEEVTAATFRPVIEKHVEECGGAGESAHDLDVSRDEWENGEVDTVSVKEVDGEIEESVASYAAAYLANDEKDLLERPPEYLAWAATMWATGTQKAIKSDSANHAIEADRCDLRHHEDEQGLQHGEEVTRTACRCATAPWGPGCSRCDGRGWHAVCLACLSPWGIEQRETLTRAKEANAVCADGGAVPERETAEMRSEEELRESWPSARSAARVGGETAERECGHAEPDTCPLCATETESPEHTVSGEVPIPESATAAVEYESVGFSRGPSWSAKCIIRDGEELPVTGGGAVDMRPLSLPSAPERVVSMAARDGAKAVCQECGAWCESPREYVEHECEGRVYVGWLPATEPPAEESGMSYEEFVDVVPESLLGVRDDHGDDRDDHADDRLEELPGEVVIDEDMTVPEVLGRNGLSPEYAELVADALKTTRTKEQNREAFRYDR